MDTSDHQATPALDHGQSLLAASLLIQDRVLSPLSATLRSLPPPVDRFFIISASPTVNPFSKPFNPVSLPFPLLSFPWHLIAAVAHSANYPPTIIISSTIANNYSLLIRIRQFSILVFFFIAQSTFRTDYSALIFVFRFGSSVSSSGLSQQRRFFFSISLPESKIIIEQSRKVERSSTTSLPTTLWHRISFLIS